MPEEKIGAAMGAGWALNNQTYIYMNGWLLALLLHKYLEKKGST